MGKRNFIQNSTGLMVNEKIIYALMASVLVIVVLGALRLTPGADAMTTSADALSERLQTIVETPFP